MKKFLISLPIPFGTLLMTWGYLNHTFGPGLERVTLALALMAAFWIHNWPTHRLLVEFIAKKLDQHRRGRRLVPHWKAKLIAAEYLKGDDLGIPFGGVALPERATSSHFCVVGSTGSGKTLTLRLLMQYALPKIIPGSDHRAVVYDPKREFGAILDGMGVSDRVVMMHPFDERGYAWDMAKDITSEASALQLAEVLVPTEENSSQPFFPNASRDLMAGVIRSFMRTAPGAWTFRDVVLAVRSRKTLVKVLNQTEDTKYLIDQYFGDERTAANISATIATMMADYGVIAAAWHKAGDRKISLRGWTKSESILVLGNDESIREALDAVNRVLFKRISELLLNEPDSETRRTWVILDEVSEAGRLDGLSSLMTKGRSKGVCNVLGFQGIEGLRNCYGEKLAHEVVGQCGNKALLRTDSDETAAWESAVIGKYQAIEHTKTMSAQAEKSESEHIVERDCVLASEFQTLPATNDKNGLTGYYLTHYTGAFKARLKARQLSSSLIPPNKDFRNFEPRDDEDQRLVPWTDEDLERLGLPKEDEEEAESTERAAEVEKATDKPEVFTLIPAQEETPPPRIVPRGTLVFQPMNEDVIDLSEANLPPAPPEPAVLEPVKAKTAADEARPSKKRPSEKWPSEKRRRV